MSSPDGWHGSDLDLPDIPPDIAAALQMVVDPCSAATGAPLSLLEMGLISRAERTGGGVVEVDLRLTSPICWNAAPMMNAVRDSLLQLPDVSDVHCTADHGLEWTPANMTGSARRRLQLIRPTAARAAHG